MAKCSLGTCRRRHPSEETLRTADGFDTIRDPSSYVGQAAIARAGRTTVTTGEVAEWSKARVC
jgi:hypothetical protein